MTTLEETILFLIQQAVQEDLGNGDITSEVCIPENDTSHAVITSKENGTLCGVEVAKKVFAHVDSTLKIVPKKNDGESISIGDIIMEISGNTRAILIAERTVLNFLQRLTAIATKTALFSKKAKKYGAFILDTRKTTPSLRLLEKYAVKTGGGKNHRFGLYDEILVKENHIKASGGIEKLLHKIHIINASREKKYPVVLEVETLQEVDILLKKGQGIVNRVLFDNFSTKELKVGVTLIRGIFDSEASGGIAEKNIENVLETGVKNISMGALTHSIKAFDFSLLLS